jgi:hypothetical protein
VFSSWSARVAITVLRLGPHSAVVSWRREFTAASVQQSRLRLPHTKSPAWAAERFPVILRGIWNFSKDRLGLYVGRL